MGAGHKNRGSPLGGGRNSLMRASRSASLMSVIAAAFRESGDVLRPF